MSSASARRALSGIAWLLPDGGPCSVPGTAGVTVFVGIFGVAPGTVEEPATADGDGRAAGCITTGGGTGPIFGGTTILMTHGHHGPGFELDQLVAWFVVVLVRIRYEDVRSTLRHGTVDGSPLNAAGWPAGGDEFYVAAQWRNSRLCGLYHT